MGHSMNRHKLNNELTVLMARHRFLFALWNDHCDQDKDQDIVLMEFEKTLIEQKDDDKHDRLDRFAIRLCMGLINKFRMHQIEEEIGLDIDGDGHIGKKAS